MAWSARIEQLAGGRSHRTVLESDGLPVPVVDVLRLWQVDAAFRSFFNAALADAPFSAFRWETPPVTSATLSRPFEFVLHDSPGLAARPDPKPFAAHFGAGEVATFPNLGGDAVLVVPTPLGPPEAYAHLAAFVRGAPEPQQHAFWAAVGAAMTHRVGGRPVWLSTAGAGVSWLHARLDDRPKYYGHAPYREVEA